MTKPVGLHCPCCGKRTLRTVDSRPVKGGIRRRKECASCGSRITTIEKIASMSRYRLEPIATTRKAG